MPMTGHGYIRAALDLVEDSLVQRHTMPSVQGIAGRIGYSVHHFSRLFSALTGLSPSDYIARRSLSLAAQRIRETDASLVEIAAECGFENYEVFSRAFRRHFDLGPREARRHPEIILACTPPLILQARSNHIALASLEPQIIEEDAHVLGGMWFFMDGSERSFHRPWAIFAKHAPGLRATAEPQRWYQYAAWTAGSSSEMNILCAMELQHGGEILQEPFFSVRSVPAMAYLRFLHVGGLDSLGASYQYIYADYLADRNLTLSSGWEFQRFASEKTGPLEICIPIEPAST